MPLPVIQNRPLHEVAADIRKYWSGMCHGYYRAKPYVDAMSRLDSIHSMYGADTAKSVVLYFLANANTWRGEDARRIKNELRAMCGMAPTVEKRKKEKV